MTITPFPQKIKTGLPCLGQLVTATGFDALHGIMQPGKNLAVLPRRAGMPLEKFIQNLNLDLFPAIQTSFYAHECSASLQVLLKNVSADKAGLTLFIKDLALVTEKFCTLLQIGLVKFHLQVVEDGLCRFFHCDYNNLRLFCTYRGAGTQWIANDNVNRARLGCRHNEKIVTDPAGIYQLEPFWVGILKGELFMNNTGNGIVHRSPPVCNKAQQRILLRLDA